MEDYKNPLGWGLSWGETKELFAAKKKKAEFYVMPGGTDERPASLTIGDCTLFNFQGDCGAVCMNGANHATTATLKDVEEWCSLSGFSKIFATIVTSPASANLTKAIFEKAGWTVISEGKSNRNSMKTDIALFKRIDCKYRGY